MYVDDGISDAEFANRPGFLRLMNALKPRPPFQVLVMSEESRLGREAIETAYALKQLVTAGVRVFFYLENRERTLDSPTDKIMLSLTAFADELEREKARQRTYDAMLRKAQAGQVTGGRVFGYDNIDVIAADGKRSHVERRINDAEATVVRRIFELSAAGTGYTRIAKLLNAEHALAPRAQQGRPTGWAPTTIHEILRRPIYRGEIVWNKTRKRDVWGQHHQSPRSRDEWLRISAPALRIVSDDLWAAAQMRLQQLRTRLAKVTNGRAGARARNLDSKYLLVGFARCGVCGGSVAATSRSHGRKRKHFYQCLAYSKRGTSICGAHLALPIDVVDEAVLGTLAGEVLTPAVVDAVVAGVLAELEPATARRNLDTLRTELSRIDREIERLTEAIATGGELASLLAAVQSRHARREELAAALNAAERAGQWAIPRRRLEQAVRDRLGRWRALLTTHVEDGRQLLREVLAGPLRFTPKGRSFVFEGEAVLGRLLSGIAGLPTFGTSPAGTERRCGPDFRRILQAA